MSETGPQNQPDEAMVDLLIKQVTDGLSPAEQRALDVLDSDVASSYLRDLERAAAALSLAGSPPVEPPAGLRVKLYDAAKAQFASAVAGGASAGGAVAGGAVASHSTVGGTGGGVTDNVLQFGAADRPPAVIRKSRSAALGWLAAAACLVLAVVSWFRPLQPTVPVADVHLTVPHAVVPPVRIPAPPPTPAEERDAMLARADSVKVNLAATKDPAASGVTGDAVWDPATQRGFLHFTGLAANDPAVQQYQIWIFDGERDKRYPVDGGVFDVPAGSAGDVVIPIRAALTIRDAKAFAVTVEKPGGVVVSGLGHVVALGKAG